MTNDEGQSPGAQVFVREHRVIKRGERVRGTVLVRNARSEAGGVFGHIPQHGGIREPERMLFGECNLPLSLCSLRTVLESINGFLEGIADLPLLGFVPLSDGYTSVAIPGDLEKGVEEEIPAALGCDQLLTRDIEELEHEI
ncbi:hypothetical protein transcription regulator lysr [Aspergillus fumigatus]|nr:hypothetical protein transcription regulator lysr [Aspergillus fumigatus]